MGAPSSDAVRSWSHFPVTASPRPLILMAPRVRVSGFHDSVTKNAWLDRCVRVTADVPAAVAAAVSGGAGDRVVVLDTATRTSRPFLTDRGEMMLPAWRLDGPDLLDGGCVVLDPEVEVWWATDDHPELMLVSGGLAVVDASGLRVSFPVSGGATTEFLSVEFEEHGSYVVGRGTTRERSLPPGFAMPLVLTGALVEGTLRRPLGARVLVGEHGQPVAAVSSIPPI